MNYLKSKLQLKMKNADHELSSNEKYEFGTRLITCIFYLVLSIIGVVLYIFDMYVMYKHRHVFDNTFYILIAYLAVGDIMYLLQIIFYTVPFSIANEFFIPEYLAQLIANGNTVLFNTIFAFLGPIALNRLMAIIGKIEFESISKNLLH